jgi:hypothetical protein
LLYQLSYPAHAPLYIELLNEQRNPIYIYYLQFFVVVVADDPDTVPVPVSCREVKQIDARFEGLNYDDCPDSPHSVSG